MSNGQNTAGGPAKGEATKETAKQDARRVADEAKGKGQEVAASAKGEAAQVAGEAKHEAKDLLRQARGEAYEQAGSQQQRLAQGLRGVGEEFSAMARGAQESDASTGTATRLSRAAAGQLDSVANWLDQRGPEDVLGEVKRFARRNPGTFLLGAGLIGLVAGRLTRSLTDDARDDGTDDYGYDRGYGYGDSSWSERRAQGIEGRQPNSTDRIADLEPRYVDGVDETSTPADLRHAQPYTGNADLHDAPVTRAGDIDPTTGRERR